jgi:hypothetical protein
MGQNRLMIAAVGGLILMLTSVSCASKSHNRTTADTAHRDRVAASDRVANTDRMSGTEGARMGDERTGITERPVPSNRTGTGDPMAKDRVIPCADQGGDMTASTECAPAGKRHRDRDGRQADTLAMANCAYHTDDRGRIIYDDPACAKRYRDQMGSSFENVRWTQESAFFDRHVGKAAQHAREAEIAANQGHQVEMRRHAELALERAKEAQRAGNVPALNEGIQNLREALRFDTAGAADPARNIHDARVNLARAGGMKPPADMRATTTAAGSQAGTATRTSRSVKGELIPQDSAATPDGSRRYLLRERDGRETPITLSPDMTQNVQSGEFVEAQVDSQGRVAAINKATD